MKKVYDGYKDLTPKGNSSIDSKDMIFVDENEEVKVKFISKFVGK